MSPAAPHIAALRSKVAGLTRSRTPDDPEYLTARQALKTAVLSARITAGLASDPPLTPEQIRHLASLVTVAPSHTLSSNLTDQADSRTRQHGKTTATTTQR
ncbi:hypothetical protein [Arthrobacter sp. B1805]|uniref:hypothetical protein n=1 Tax=Arthrobacter sp. B1805 TaxID=2058892 RepID=UPI0015E37897|nr:hypothetical protein [Arthrobacter sp. B1805]